MKQKGRKIAGLLIILANVLVLVNGIHDGKFSAILSSISFIIIGIIYLLEKSE